MPDTLNNFSRRDFLRLGSITAAAISIPELHAEASKALAPTMNSIIWRVFSSPAPIRTDGLKSAHTTVKLIEIWLICAIQGIVTIRWLKSFRMV